MSLGVLVAVGSAAFEARLLAAADSPGLHVVRRCLDVADLLATAASRQAQVAVVAATLHGLDADIVARLRADDVVVVGIASGADDAAGWLTGIGVDVVVPAEQLDTLATVARAHVGRDPEASPATERAETGTTWVTEDVTRGSLVAVWGPTGAPGRSTVALGLASELAGQDRDTMLIDADVYGGTVAQQLGLLDEASGLLAAARAANTGRLDIETLAGLAREVNPGLRVLTGLPRADRWTELRPALLRTVTDVAGSLCDVTVIDCGFSIELDEEISYDTAAPRRNGATVAALELADVVVVVGRADAVGLSRLVRGLSELDSLIAVSEAEVVVNRLRPSLGWSAAEISSMLHSTSAAASIVMLPDDQQACDRATVLGKTLAECAPDAKLRKALLSLSEQVLDRLPELAVLSG